MVQEILNNAVKHSGAKSIEISIHEKENSFIFDIQDDGKGFNPKEKMKSGGTGLLNLQSRAKLIQATVSVQSAVGNGTKISIELPLTPHNALANNNY
jgi:signal transduction histidine kinase